MSRWYYAATVFFLLQTTTALGVIDRMIYGSWAGKGGDKLSQTLNLIQMMISLALFCWGFRKRRMIGTGGMLALSLALLFLLSAAWSVDPPTTIRRGFIYLFFVFGAIGVGNLYDGDRFLKILADICCACAIASLLLLVVSPANALVVVPSSGPLTPGSIDFRGIFPHKNVLGQVMAGGALAILHGIRLGGRRQLRQFLMLGFVFAVAIGAKSATSVMTILAFCGISGTVVLIRRGGAGRIIGLVSCMFLAISIVIGAVFPDLLLQAIGKDPTLTGRTELWAYVLAAIADRLALGWGFSAFWSEVNPRAEAISTALGWVVPEAHNGLLEMLLQLGIVGTAMMLFVWARTVVLGSRCMRTAARELGFSTLLCCLGFVLVGTTEEVLLDPGAVSVGIFFITGFMCERALRTMRRRRYVPRQAYPRPIPARPWMSGPGTG